MYIFETYFNILKTRRHIIYPTCEPTYLLGRYQKFGVIILILHLHMLFYLKHIKDHKTQIDPTCKYTYLLGDSINLNPSYFSYLCTCSFTWNSKKPHKIVNTILLTYQPTYLFTWKTLESCRHVTCSNCIHVIFSKERLNITRCNAYHFANLMFYLEHSNNYLSQTFKHVLLGTLTIA